MLLTPVCETPVSCTVCFSTSLLWLCCISSCLLNQIYCQCRRSLGTVSPLRLWTSTEMTSSFITPPWCWKCVMKFCFMFRNLMDADSRRVRTDTPETDTILVLNGGTEHFLCFWWIPIKNEGNVLFRIFSRHAAALHDVCDRAGRGACCGHSKLFFIKH